MTAAEGESRSEGFSASSYVLRAFLISLPTRRSIRRGRRSRALSFACCGSAIRGGSGVLPKALAREGLPGPQYATTRAVSAANDASRLVLFFLQALRTTAARAP